MTDIAKATPQEQLKLNTSQKFEALKTQAAELTDQCKSIKIKDTGTLSMAQQVLSTSNQLSNMIEAKRTAIKKPYIEAGKMIDKIAAELSDPLDAAIKLGKAELQKWNDAEAERKKLQDAENEKLVKKLTDIRMQLEAKTKACLTPEKCQNLIDSINKVFPAKESFKQYANDAEIVKTNFLQLLRIRKTTLEAAMSGNVNEFSKSTTAESEVIAAVEVAASAVIEKKEAISEANVATQSATRKSYKFEIVDESKVSRALLSVDDKKVREYMNTIKDKITKDGITIDGIKYFLENNVTIR